MEQSLRGPMAGTRVCLGILHIHVLVIKTPRKDKDKDWKRAGPYTAERVTDTMLKARMDKLRIDVVCLPTCMIIYFVVVTIPSN